MPPCGLRDLAIPPGNRLEALKGDHRGLHAIRINDLSRVVFLDLLGHQPEQTSAIGQVEGPALVRGSWRSASRRICRGTCSHASAVGATITTGIGTRRRWRASTDSPSPSRL